MNRNQTGITGAHSHHTQSYLWHINFHNPKPLVSALYWSDSEPHNGSLTAKTFALLVFYFKKIKKGKHAKQAGLMIELLLLIRAGQRTQPLSTGSDKNGERKSFLPPPPTV